MSEEPKRLEEPMYSDKKWGIIIILAAIGLIILTVCTNFFSGLSAFGPDEFGSGEKETSNVVTENNNEDVVINPVEDIIINPVENTEEDSNANTLRITFDEQSGD